MGREIQERNSYVLMLDEQIRVGMGEKFLGKYDGKWNLSKDTVAF